MSAHSHGEVFEPYPALPEYAEQVRAKARSARSGVAIALARIARLDGRIHAFQEVFDQQALEQADRLDRGGPGHDGPLAGVPVAVKADFDIAGSVTSHGGLAQSTPAASDSEVVRRLRAAGAIVVGTTTMPEMAQFPFTESRRFGITNNPRADGRTVGGSSGGSAAAVAAGMVPLAVGGDAGGSIRIPASCTGLFGLKPQRGRVSGAPHREVWGALYAPGVLTRTAVDSAWVYDILAGALPSDRWHATPLSSPLTQATSTDPASLRIGWTTDRPDHGRFVDPQLAAAVSRLAERLSGLGHQVHQVHPAWPSYRSTVYLQFVRGVYEIAQQLDHPDRLESVTKGTVSLGGRVPARAYERAMAAAGSLGARVDELIGEDDLLLTPTMACLPPPVGALDGSRWALIQRTLPMVAFTQLFNAGGQPAASYPAGLSTQGWPIGVQLVARTGGEATILAVAAQLDRTGAAVSAATN